MLVITTKIPSSLFSPNSKVHWARKIKPKKIDKDAGFFAAKEATKCSKPFKHDDKIIMHLKFFYHTRAHHDDDNSIASFKHIRDGIALALGINDKNISTAKPELLYDKQNPRTVVTLVVA